MAATTLDAAQGEAAHLSPHFLPDGRHFVYVARGTSASEVIWAGSLDSKERVRLLSGTGGAAYAGPPRGPGYLLYDKAGIATAQPFDPVRLRLLSGPVPIPGLPKVNASQAFGASSIAVSQNGVLVQHDPTEVTELVWFDRSGKRLSTVARGDAYTHVALSRDDARVVYNAQDETTPGVNVWVADLARESAKTRLTYGQTTSTIPIWSSDGTQVVYGTTRGRIYRKAGNGTGQEEVLVESKNWLIPSCWSADGRYLVYHEVDPKTADDIWVLTLGGDRRPRAYLRTQFDERNGQISPDGRWMAYSSNESGKLEVYVSTFPDANGGKWPVSIGGGAQALWRRDGKELFYLSPEMKVMSVEVKTGVRAFEASRPKVLFARLPGGLGYTNRGVDYAVTADGQRFLANTAVDERGSSAITVLTNWTEGLKK